ncbi:MAG: GAF domain-containing protein [Acidobacteria bacterium]|nr:GAF domain-containing protein [Acidobacteriota bacterium]
MSYIIVLKAEHEYPAPALLDALRGADVRAAVTCTPVPEADGAEPLAVLCEVADGADVTEIHAAVARASTAWPRAPLVACRRVAPEENPGVGRRLDAAALTRLGFRAVAALHFVSDQTSAAQTALAGVAPLAPADRWTIYLTEAEGAGKETRFEPLAARGLTPSERAHAPGDPLGVTRADPLLSLVGKESAAAREASVSAETVRREEGGARSVLAVPLVCDDRVLGVLEAVREGSRARAFSDADAALLTSLAVPAAAALANSVRIAEAERLSLTDDLTKLHNARFLRQYLTATSTTSKRSTTGTATSSARTC